MTDLERLAPHSLPVVASPSGSTDQNASSHPETAPRSDGPSMSLTLATRNPGRPITELANPPPAPDDRGRSWLTRLFAGDLGLQTLAPAPLPPIDRPVVELDAIARILGCHELFVLEAPDRLIRERVIVDFARIAAARGERILVLSPDPAAADRMAEAIASDPSLKIIRALAEDENPIRALPLVSRITSIALGQRRIEQMKQDAMAAVARSEAELTTIAAALTAAEDLRLLAVRLSEIEPDRRALSARLDRLDTEVRAEAEEIHSSNAFTARLSVLRIDREAATAPLVASLAALATQRADKETALAAARQLLAGATVDAGKKTGFFARFLHKPKHQTDPAEFDRQIMETEREVKELVAREASIHAEAEAVGGRFDAEREKCIAEEVTTRRTTTEARLAELTRDRDEIAGRFAARARELDRAGFTPPAQLTVEAANRVTADLTPCWEEVAKRVAAARERLNQLIQSLPELLRQFLGDARVVIGTPGSVDSDPAFEPRQDLSAPAFSVLVLDHAEELTEPDFTRLAVLARRWVLAGTAPGEDSRQLPIMAAPGSRPGRPTGPTFFARLVRLLDREPWAIEGDRLVFRLCHVPSDQRRQLTREPVLDRPEIELRFTTEGADAVLAEVAFPSGSTVASSKAYLYEQLGEVLLRPCGERIWERSDDLLLARWPAAGVTGGDWIELDVGVREKIIGTGPAAFTAVVSFNLAAGWSEQTAEAWLSAHLPPLSVGRVAVLPRLAPHGVSPHRPTAVV